MFALVQEIQHNWDSPYELLKQGTEQVIDNHQEWWRLEFQDILSLKPNPAPNWDTADIIWSINNNGGHYKQFNIFLGTPETGDQYGLAYIGLTTDINDDSVPASPYWLWYYKQQQTDKPNTTIPTNILVRLQIDWGADRLLTNQRDLLSRYQPTATYNIYGINKDDGKGCLPWLSDNGDTIYIPCYYSLDAAETIISPTDAVL